MTSFISHGGEEVALLLTPPNRNQKFAVSPSIPANIQKALSGAVDRRNFARSLRYSLEFTIDTLFAALGEGKTARETTDLRLWLLRLKGETVAVPMWNDFVEISSAFNAGATSLPIAYGLPVRAGAEWIILSEDDPSVYEIVTVDPLTSTSTNLATSATTLNWPAGTYLYPLLFGKFVERPTFDARTDEVVTGAVKVEDNSPFSKRLTVLSGAIPLVGASVAEFATYPLWTAEPSRVRVLDSTEAAILYKQVGFLRQAQQYIYSQPNARALEMEFYCGTRAEIAAIERLFSDRRGPVKPFLIPTFNGDLRLAADVAAGATTLPIEASRYTDPDYASSHPGWPYLAIITQLPGQTATIEPIRVDDIGIDVSLVEPVAADHAKLHSIVSHLLLVTFAEAKLDWNHLTDGKATVRAKFLEWPSEYATPASEPEPMFLYRFTEKMQTPQISRFTNYENSVTIGAETFAPGPFDHGAIKISLRPGETTAELMSWGGNSNGNPLAKFLPFDLEADLESEILEANAADLTAPLITLFKGDVMSVQQRGTDWKADCAWLGKMFDRKIPHFLVQKPDNNIQFSRPTWLDRAPFRYGATITSLSADKMTIVCGSLGGSPDPTGTAGNFFGNGGFLEIGAGATFKTRAIIHSSVAGGAITLVLDRPLDFPAGSTFNLWPGYDGSIEQEISRFDNQINHGGHPFVTDTGPQIKAVEAKQSGGGKKG